MKILKTIITIIIIIITIFAENPGHLILLTLLLINNFLCWNYIYITKVKDNYVVGIKRYDEKQKELFENKINKMSEK